MLLTPVPVEPSPVVDPMNSLVEALKPTLPEIIRMSLTSILPQRDEIRWPPFPTAPVESDTAIDNPWLAPMDIMVSMDPAASTASVGSMTSMDPAALDPVWHSTIDGTTAFSIGLVLSALVAS